MKTANHFPSRRPADDGRQCWMKIALCAAVAALAASGPRVVAKSSQELGKVNISVRDSMTGFAIRTTLASASLKDGASTLLSTDASGRGQYDLSAGRHDFEIAPPGYQVLSTYFEVIPQTTLPVTVWLDPKEPPAELRPEVVTSKLKPGYVMLHGHVADSSGAPMEGVRVYLEYARSGAETDSNGYFLFYAAITPTDGLPGADNLIAESDGYKTYLGTNVLLPEGDVHFIFDMEQGTGVTARDHTHKMMRSSGELLNSQIRTESTAGGQEGGGAPRTVQKLGPGGIVLPLAVSVPSSIRVGFNCDCSTCDTVQVYSLETYVRLGLDDEWIASWSANSLRAGAVAYRSYGVYHVYHPKATNYDICSTTCCQVNDPNTSSVNTDNATADTAGVIVVDSTVNNPFFAEYAAENNDNFCADGSTGDPALNWPCMSDSVCAGQLFNGHGRGMCQWGTQRWSANQLKDWTWIVNHYYNNNGSPSGARSGILQTPGPDFSLSASPASQTVTAGGSTSYTVTVTPSGGFTGTVTFSVSGLPSGATATFNPTSVAGSGSSTMTVATSSTTPAGTYPLTISGTSGTLTHTTSVTLVVSAPATPDFSLSISPTSVSVPGAGGTATYAVSITRTGGFTDAVTLSVSGLPVGATGSFSPNPATGTSSTLTVTVSSATAKGTYTFTVTGTGGTPTLTRTATANLVKKQH